MNQTQERPDTLGTSGVLTIFACPGVLTKHVEWATSRVLGEIVSIPWRQQTLVPGTFQASIEWRGPVGSAAQLASAMHGWKQLRFEVSEQQTSESMGGRWMHTPGLGIFHAQTDAAGNFVLTENQLLSIVNEAAGDPAVYEGEVRLALGVAWDEELDPFRMNHHEGSPDAIITSIHAV